MAPNDIPSWSSLKGQAADGHLTLKEGAIEELVSACDASIGRLLALKAFIDQMNNVKAFAQSLGSSNTLAQKYVTSANTLGDILKAHLDIHYDLADTLIAARRAYVKAELAGKEEFDQLQRLAKIPPRTTKPGSFHSDPSKVESEYVQNGFTGFDNLKAGKIKNANGNPNGYSVGDLPSNLKSYSGPKFVGVPAEGENPDSWGYERFRTIGTEIDYETPGRQAGNWKWMAGELEEVFQTLNNKVGAVANGDKWGGTGAAGARSATEAYVKDTQNLRTQMKVMEYNLSYTAGWLRLTKGSMPTGPDVSGQTPAAPKGPVITAPGGGNPPPNIAYPDQTPIYRENFKNTYLIGLPESDTSVPTLPFPTSPTTGRGPTNTGPGSPGTSGGGTGGGTGATAAQTAALNRAQQAADAQRKEIAKAQQEADQRAKQQQADYERQRQQAEQQAAAQRAAEQQQQSAQQVAEQAKQAAQQGMDGVKQAVDQASQAAQQAQAAAAKDMQSAGLAGLPSALSALGKDALKAGGGAGLGKGGGAGGGAGAGAGAGLSPNSLQNSKLFPRAAAEAAGAATASRAGIATAGQAGSPGGMGPAGHGAGHGQKEHKRAAYLDSVEHIEEALGEAPVVVKPVVEK